MFRRVLLCYDGSNSGRRALKKGAELAKLVGAQVYVLSVMPSGLADPIVAAGAVGACCVVPDDLNNRVLMQTALAWLKEQGVESQGFMAVGTTFEQICKYTKQLQIDLIVLGHYPLPTGGSWWTGAKQTPLAELANCCVLVAVDNTKSSDLR